MKKMPYELTDMEKSLIRSSDYTGDEFEVFVFPKRQFRWLAIRRWKGEWYKVVKLWSMDKTTDPLPVIEAVQAYLRERGRTVVGRAIDPYSKPTNKPG